MTAFGLTDAEGAAAASGRAARRMAGISLAEQGITAEVVPPYYSVKETVFPFLKFPGVDTILGPEMKSTGEAIRFIKDLRDPYFRNLYKERSMHLSK